MSKIFRKIKKSFRKNKTIKNKAFPFGEFKGQKWGDVKESLTALDKVGVLTQVENLFNFQAELKNNAENNPVPFFIKDLLKDGKFLEKAHGIIGDDEYFNKYKEAFGVYLDLCKQPKNIRRIGIERSRSTSDSVSIRQYLSELDEKEPDCSIKPKSFRKFTGDFDEKGRS